MFLVMIKAVKFSDGLYPPENEHDNGEKKDLKMHLPFSELEVIFQRSPC